MKMSEFRSDAGIYQALREPCQIRQTEPMDSGQARKQSPRLPDFTNGPFTINIDSPVAQLKRVCPNSAIAVS
jgi:hypothetical protein